MLYIYHIYKYIYFYLQKQNARMGKEFLRSKRNDRIIYTDTKMYNKAVIERIWYTITKHCQINRRKERTEAHWNPYGNAVSFLKGCMSSQRGRGLINDLRTPDKLPFKKR